MPEHPPECAGLVCGDVTDDTEDTYDAMTCNACGQLHFVNRATGKVLGDERDSGA
jgi:hypothetical protein